MTLPTPIEIPYEIGKKLGEKLASGDTQGGGLMEILGTIAIVGLGAGLIGSGLVKLFGRRAVQVAETVGKVAV